MNVLYYLDFFPKLSESFILNEIYYLTQHGHKVAVFSMNESETDLSHEELDEIDVDVGYPSVPSAVSVPRELFWSVFDDRSSYSSHFHDFRRKIGTRFLIKQVHDFLDTLEYDINHVHAHFARWNKLPAAVVADDIGITSTLTTHAYDLYASPDEEMLKTVCDAFDTILTISEYNESYLRVEIDPDADIEVVRMGIRTEKFTPIETASEPRFLTVARFVEKKGIEYALFAFAKVVEEYPEVGYRIVGSGPRRDRYDRIIRQLGIENNVTFLGSVSDDRLVRELGEATGFMLPCVVAKDGDRDGIPVSLMEAMAMETPVVTSRVSGIPELIIDEENGHLVRSRDTEEISETLKRILNGTANQEAGKNGRDTVVDNFDAAKTVRDLTSKFIGD